MFAIDDRNVKPSFRDALALIVAASPRAKHEAVSVDTSLGRITASEVRACRDHPKFDTSAMDGYAFNAELTCNASNAAPLYVPLGDDCRAGGKIVQAQIGMGHPISTGAVIPPTCNTVITKERSVTLGDHDRRVLKFTLPETQGRNVRLRGEDAREGDLILSPGRLITAETIGALACYEIDQLVVHKRPRLLVLSTGDEVVDKASGCGITDANGPMIAAAAAATGLGLPVSRIAAVSDDPQNIARAIRSTLAGKTSDIIISTGGVSAGNHDHVPSVLRELGATIHFHGVRIRPGKPVVFASFDDGTLFFGLPGNPVAALVGFRFFVLAAIRTMLGQQLERGELTSLDVSAREGITTFLAARRVADETGGSNVEILSGQKSHTMRPLLKANRWVLSEFDRLGRNVAEIFPLSPSFI